MGSAAKGGDGFGNGGLYSGAVQDIGHMIDAADTVAFHFPAGVGQLFLTPGDQTEIRARLCERSGERPTKALGAAGDKNSFSGEIKAFEHNTVTSFLRPGDAFYQPLTDPAVKPPITYLEHTI